jgi:hypothetical protein
VELSGASYLYTLATVSITFVGFSVFFILIRQALGQTMSEFDIFLTRNFLQLGFTVAVCALLAPLLSLLEVLGNAFGWPLAPGVGLYACGLTIVLSISFLAFLHALDRVLEQPKRVGDGLDSPGAGNGPTLTGQPHIGASGGNRRGPPG